MQYQMPDARCQQYLTSCEESHNRAEESWSSLPFAVNRWELVEGNNLQIHFQAEQWSPWECHATPTNGCRWYVWWSFSWASQLWWVSKIDFVAGLEKKIGNSKRILLQREVYVVRVHSMGGVGKQLRHWPSATRKRLKVYQLPSPDDVDALLLFCFRGLGHLWTSIQASVPPTIAEFYVYVIYCCVEFVNDYNMPGKDGYTCIH